jgi:hypothetical protein
MALLMNKDFDRDREEQRRLAEQAQREREERLSGSGRTSPPRCRSEAQSGD